MKRILTLTGCCLWTLALSANELIVQWNFNGTNQPAQPAPTSGSGAAALIGGATAGFVSGSGSSDPTTDGDFAWNLGSFPAADQAPGTAGAEFTLSTSGYTQAVLSFDWRASNTASRRLQVLCAIDDVEFVPVADFEIAAGASYTNRLSVDLGALAGADDRERVAIRLVSEFAEDQQYLAANRTSTYSASGTWRFDLVTVTGLRLGTEALPPSLLESPTNQIAADQGTASFTVISSGTPPLTIEWQKDGTNLSGISGPTLTLAKVTLADAGLYRAVVRNDYGEVTSAPATLTVIQAPRIAFTNVLERLLRPGDLTTNTFAEHALRPGERLVSTVDITDPQGLPVEVSVDATGLPSGIRWESLPVVADQQPGRLVCEPTAADAGGEFVVRLLAWNSTATNSLTWKIHVPTAIEQQIVITEFLANPTSSSASAHFNPLRRSTPSTNPGRDDEYVEIVNLSSETVNLAGWTLYDSTTSRPRVTFPDPLWLAPGHCVVVYGGSPEGAPVGLDVPAIPSKEASGLALNNTGDHLVLRNASGRLVDRIVYGNAELSNDCALARYPDASGAFTAHTDSGNGPVSPGRQADGTPWGEPDVPPPSEPGPIKVELAVDGAVEITWSPIAEQPCSVWSAPSLSGPYTRVAEGLIEGRYVDPNASETGVRFYRLSCP
ncbi:MAG: lamin tail domain-containing protein [Limisphaerales bacterium]